MLEIKNVYKSYAGEPLLRGISFQVARGETVCLLGPSGSGKSTLLRIIAGLDAPDAGEICWDGEEITPRPPHLRRMGMVFQDYALFPHLSVAENVAFGLRMQNWPPAEREARVGEVLAQVHLNGFESRRVFELSGGEQQRVALARALAPRPHVIMFDEPLGALDRALREELLQELRTLLRSQPIAAIYVTHDQEEAAAIADRLLLLHQGRIVRAGTPSELWRDPGSVWAARFLGLGNVLVGRWQSEGGQAWLVTEFGRFRLSCNHNGHPPAGRVYALLRPEAVTADADQAEWRARVTDVIFQQGRYRVQLQGELYIFLSEAPVVGEWLNLRLAPQAVQCLGEEDAGE